MASAKSRTRARRRDRRKAKASGFRREGKQSPSKIGHGNANKTGRHRTTVLDIVDVAPAPVVRPAFRVSIADRLTAPTGTPRSRQTQPPRRT